MKKFAFLLALVAVFAMSACAFAVEPGDVTLAPITNFDPTQNNSKIANNSTKVYYFGTAPSEFVLGLNAEVVGADSGPVQTNPLAANWSKKEETADMVTLVASLSAVSNPNLVKTINNAVLTGDGADTVLKIGVIESSTNDWLVDSTPALLTIVPTVVSADVANVIVNPRQKHILRNYSVSANISEIFMIRYANTSNRWAMTSHLTPSSYT